jgi:uncharacterized GH25 family protein
MSRFRLVAAVLAAVLAAGVTQAHDLKVLASQLAGAKPGGKSTIYLSWGHRLPVDDLVDGSSLDRYELLGPTGTATPLKKADLSLQENVVELQEPGVYQVLAARKPGTYTFVLDADGNRVLKRGPKTDVKEGKIDYSMRSQQFAKALLVVGTPSKEPVKAAGLPLEIVPQEGPAAWTGGATLHFLVLLDGKPLPEAEVTARSVGYKPDNAWGYATTTNRDGVAGVLPAQAGTWVLRVNSKRLTSGPTREQYDFDSMTATLTLEIQP